MSDVFSRFAPFVQDFIYAHDWESLRGIQVAAAEAIFDTDEHVLLTSSTASGKTEAAVMREILLERGVAEEKLALEDQAATTKENFKNAALLVDPGAPIALITSNYHMDRAVQTAKSAGLASVLRQPAPSSALYFGANVMWETVLEVNELAYGRGRRCFRPRENQRRK